MPAADKPSFRFPNTSRLVCSTEYRSVIAYDCRSKDALFVVYARGNNQQRSRLGITVSRHVAPKAVERNRIKRVVRESFRRQRKRLQGLDIVTITRGAARNVDTKLLFKSLKEHWRRVDQQCRHAS
jgi:ribonuclease P protein component